MDEGEELADEDVDADMEEDALTDAVVPVGKFPLRCTAAAQR